MADTRLNEFVDAALRAGKSRDEIARTLEAAGWPAEQIDDALRQFADVDFPVPVPRPRAHLSARDAFVYLLLFGTLYVSAYQLGSLLFDFINLGFPEGYSVYQIAGFERGIRWGTASLIVAFPVFLWLASKLAREVAADATRRQSAIRRWLTYITLLIASGVIVGDTITLVYNLLSGDLTLRFILKVLVVAVITGAIFGYYLHAIRKDNQETAK